MFRVFPDYLVVRESEIYRLTGQRRYRPLRRWNRDVRRTRRAVRAQLRPMIRLWQKEIIDQFPCNDHAGRSNQLWFRADTEVAIQIEETLQEKMQDYPDALVYRNGTDVYLGFTFFTKGAALAEIAAMEDLPRDQIFAAGDGPNDVSMLDGNVAAWCAAVANADPKVIDQVRRANGYVASAPCAEGVIEALDWADRSETVPARP
jgi:hydroxymethylpyrimidine pyrophosphatase-like HAD family hydrolase